MNEKELLSALGPLRQPYQDESVREILVDSFDQIYGEIDGKLIDLDIRFDSEEAYQKVIEDVLALRGESLFAQKTFADIRLPDDSRFITAVPPTAIQGPYLAIRKPFVGDMTWERLLEYGAVSQEIIDFIKGALQAEVNLLISGGTGSGKTTLLNLIAELISPEKRIVAVEDVHHLRIDHPRVVYLEAQGGKTPMDELIEIGSRMFPGWLIVNEIQGPGTIKTLQKYSSGYSGMGSLHAVNLEDALSRLESYCLMANMGLSLAEVRNLIVNSIRLICHQDHLPNGKRRIVQAAEIQGLENNRYIIQPLFRYLPETDEYQFTGVKPSWEL